MKTKHVLTAFIGIISSAFIFYSCEKEIKDKNNGETKIVDVTNPATGQTWMDRNLGANRAATSIADIHSYGDLYQWGRASDGHQLIDRTNNKPIADNTTKLSSSDTPDHDNFILVSKSPYDWRKPQNDNLWQGVKGINNPCPSGYRLPTETELNAERDSWSTNNAEGAFGSPLKLPAAGARYSNDGSLTFVGSSGFYLTSTIKGTRVRYLYFGSDGASMGSSCRAYSFSVRCIKDE